MSFEAKQDTRKGQVGSSQKPCKNSHEGTVVSMTGNRLTMMCVEGKEHQYILADNAKVILHGRVCQVKDLKPDNPVRVTIEKGDETVATCVESL